MDSYYVNNNTDNRGDHEVHKVGCHVMPSNKTYLGEFNNCWEAVAKAKQSFIQVNGCIHCARECHTQ